jgi:hypothetical protein
MMLWRPAVWFGLGLWAGAVLTSASAAQQPDSSRTRRDSTRIAIPAKPPSDSLLRDSLAKRDSMRSAVPLPAKPPRDTIKAPITRAEMPVIIGIGETRCWNRETLFATGAITLQDLLDRVAGVTGIRGGWISAPMATSYLGDVSRLRLFYDGMELDQLDPRAGNVVDASQVPLFPLEGLCIERGSRELRVHMRSWRVNNTTPNTRTDISTGDQSTNLYRGYFGRRYNGGEAVQFAAQQYGTTPSRAFASSDQLGILARIGLARQLWSVDASAVRVSRHRGTLPVSDFRLIGSAGVRDSILGVESARTDAYVRAGYGNPDEGLWAQAIAGLQQYKFTGVKRDSTAADTTKIPSADTTRFHAQYVITGGIGALGLRLSGAGRLHVLSGEGRSVFVPTARASYDTKYLALSGLMEGKGVDSLSRIEAAARLSPLPFVSVAAWASRDKDERGGAGGLTTNNLRAEAGVQVHGLWLIGGVVRRDTSYLPPPRLFDFDTSRTFAPTVDGVATGVTAGIRGTIYKAIKADISAIRWNDTAGFYRPRLQARSEIYVQTNWLSRFPSGNFGFLYSFVHEYRSNMHFPVFQQNGGTTTVGDTIVGGYRSLNSLLEIRILSAVAFWQFRNFMGERYSNVPGFLMPRQTQFYGVRWEFWN